VRGGERVARDDGLNRDAGLESVFDEVCAVEQNAVIVPFACKFAACPDDGVLAARDFDGHETRE
jgi:hypothetical protein